MEYNGFIKRTNQILLGADMKIIVRYYSRSGNTKMIAEAIGKAIDADVRSVDSVTDDKADVLFAGGALYAYGLDHHLNEYLDSMKNENVGKAVLFSSTWISNHSLDLMRKKFEEKGIEVCSESFYVRGKPSVKQLEEAAGFARRCVETC